MEFTENRIIVKMWIDLFGKFNNFTMNGIMNMLNNRNERIDTGADLLQATDFYGWSIGWQDRLN